MAINVGLYGDRFKAGNYISLGQSLLRQLEGDMSFQGLTIGSRQLSLQDGTIIDVSVAGGQRNLRIYTPPKAQPKPEELPSITCWCSCCFAEARVLEVITPGNYSWYGYYSPDQNVYPEICNVTDIAVQNYTGIRYRVQVCQKNHWAEWIAISSDFAEYSVGDSVVILFRGNWRGNIQADSRCFGCNSGCGDQACQANWPAGRVFLRTWNLADGTFVIVPLEVGNIGRPQT